MLNKMKGPGFIVLVVTIMGLGAVLSGCAEHSRRYYIGYDVYNAGKESKEYTEPKAVK